MKKFLLIFVVLLTTEIYCDKLKAVNDNKKVVEDKPATVEGKDKEVVEDKKKEVAKVAEEVVTQKAKAVEDNKVDISVYFESLCPDSFKFIKEQLHPHYNDIAPYVNLNLIPFGKSNSIENTTKFNCHHGPQECKGNKILSCAYERLSDKSKQVDFTACFMETFKTQRDNEKEFGQECAKSVGLDANRILDCYNSEEGLKHQLEAEKETKKVSPKSVPTIVYNNEFDQKLQESSLTKFKDVVCELAKKKNPEACQPAPVLPL